MYFSQNIRVIKNFNEIHKYKMCLNDEYYNKYVNYCVKLLDVLCLEENVELSFNSMDFFEKIVTFFQFNGYSFWFCRFVCFFFFFFNILKFKLGLSNMSTSCEVDTSTSLGINMNHFFFPGYKNGVDIEQCSENGDSF